jgi:phosphate:Na+ symporter
VGNISDNEQISEPEQSVSAPEVSQHETTPPNEEALEEVIDDLTIAIRDKHIERMRRGECSPELGVYLSDLLINCDRVSDHCSNIAISIIQIARSSMNYHVYINELKAQRSGQFMAAYNSYHEKYRLSA